MPHVLKIDENENMKRSEVLDMEQPDGTTMPSCDQHNMWTLGNGNSSIRISSQKHRQHEFEAHTWLQERCWPEHEMQSTLGPKPSKPGGHHFL